MPLRRIRKARPSNQPDESAKPKCVVLVDDDSLVRNALTRLLRSAGFIVHAFAQSSEVLSSRLPERDACLILDIYMPEMNGVDLWRQLRASGVKLPTILITGRKDAAAIRAGQEVDAVSILYKPIDESALFESIERALTGARD